MLNYKKRKETLDSFHVSLLELEVLKPYVQRNRDENLQLRKRDFGTKMQHDVANCI
jgi:hypothetical protein